VSRRSKAEDAETVRCFESGDMVVRVPRIGNRTAARYWQARGTDASLPRQSLVGCMLPERLCAVHCAFMRRRLYARCHR
jgi:hypothetical protein